MNTGFTLIELLVVVLIIGILAAIAFPQYQKAVERSRIAEAVQVLGDFASAQSVHYMQHNQWATRASDTDITTPKPGDAFTYEGPDPAFGNGVSLLATRASGMYEGGILAIAVEPDGTLHKACQEPEGKTGFCILAEPAGYLLDDITGDGGKDDIGGSIIDIPIVIREDCPKGSYPCGNGQCCVTYR